MSARNTYAFVHLGCNANRADADGMAQKLDAAGFMGVATPREADTVVVMTCAFTYERQRQSLQEIESALELGPGTNVVVSGCLPAISGVPIANNSQLLVVNPRDLDLAFIARLRPKPGGTGVVRTALPAPSSSRVQRVRVSRGCAGHCSFCVIPRATGPLESRGIEEVRQDVFAALARGCGKIILSGEDVGAYGRDRGSSLAALLTDLLAIDADFELVVESVNPQWLDRLLASSSELLEDRRISAQWYVPLQAATDSLLRVMRRPYNISQGLRSLRRLREIRPDAFIVTDFIVGHPGETLSDVQEAAALFRRFAFDRVEIMRFDAHDGAKATSLSGQIGEEEGRRRALALIVAFVRELMERRGVSGIDAIAAYLDSIPLLPVNTNLMPRELAGLLTAHDSGRTGKPWLTGARTGTDPWDVPEFAAALAAKVVAKVGAPRSINQGLVESPN